MGKMVSIKTPDGRVLTLPANSLKGNELVKRFQKSGKSLIRTKASDGTTQLIENNDEVVPFEKDDHLEVLSRFYGG